MKKILNASSAYDDRMLEGICVASSESYRLIGEWVLMRNDKPLNLKVGIVNVGGSVCSGQGGQYPL